MQPCEDRLVLSVNNNETLGDGLCMACSLMTLRPRHKCSKVSRADRAS